MPSHIYQNNLTMIFSFSNNYWETSKVSNMSCDIIFKLVVKGQKVSEQEHPLKDDAADFPK